MATMPDTLTVKVVAEPVVTRCISPDLEHDFNPAPTSGEWMLLFCENCAMMIDVRFSNGSGS